MNVKRVLVGTLLVAFVFASRSLALTPWPAEGARVCSVPGNPPSLLHDPGVCSGAMGLAWFGAGPGADTLRSAYVTDQPPTGECPAGGLAIANDPRRVCTARLLPCVVPAFPGCYENPPAFAWVTGTGSGEELALTGLLGYLPQVVDDGPAGAGRTSLSLVGGEPANGCDTSAVVVWIDDRSGVAQVRAQKVGVSGTRVWGAHGVVVAPTGEEQQSASAVRLLDGSTLILWLDRRGGASDVYVQRLLPDGAPAAGWPATGRALEARGEMSWSPRFARVGTPWVAQPYVVWRESGPRFPGIASIVARRLDLDGLPAVTWPDTGIALTRLNTVEALLAVRSQDDASGLVAVWSDLRSSMPANDCDLYAQRLLADGSRATGWPASGLALSRAPGRETEADVDVFPNGVAAFAWARTVVATPQVFAAVRNPDGSIPCCDWPADGLAAGPGSAAQFAPIVEADNGGGAFVAWLDGRDVASSGVGVWAQALTYDGRKADVPPRPGVGTTMLPPRPNPARAAVRLVLLLGAPTHVRMGVVDVNGRHVRTLADTDCAAGERAWTWDGLDEAGHAQPPGLYFVVGNAGGMVLTQRVIRIR